MRAVIIKHYQYVDCEKNEKFSHEVAFTRANAVVQTLSNVNGIDDIVLLVPDHEYKASKKFVMLPDERVIPLTKWEMVSSFREANPVLFIDEQAFYVPETLLSEAIQLSIADNCVVWDDPDNLLTSFAYRNSFYFFIAPGQMVGKEFSSSTDFLQLFQMISGHSQTAKLSITAKEIPAIYAKWIQYNPFPYHYAIEPTSRCDSKCIMCPFHSPDPEIAKGSVYLGEGGDDMPLQNFQRIIDEIDRLPWNYLPEYRKPQITAQLRGEPLLAKNFKEMCSYVKEKGMFLSFSTNGNTLNQNGMIDFLLNIGLDEIIISIDPDEESFMKIRPQLDYATVLNNIATLRKKRDGLKRNVPTMYSKTIFLRGAKTDTMEEIATFLTKFVDASGFSVENFIDFTTGTKAYSGNFFSVSPEKRIPCLLIADVLSIHANGQVKLCYGDVDSSLGNIFTDSLVSILKSSPLRRSLLQQNAQGIFDAHEPCRACTSWISQYNRTKVIDGFQVTENPVMSFWKKENCVPQATSLTARVIHHIKAIVQKLKLW